MKQDYTIEYHQGKSIAYYPGLDLSDFNKPITAIESYQLPVELKEVERQAVAERKEAGQVIFNGECLGLACDLDQDTIQLKAIDYFSTIACHEAYLQEKYQAWIKPFLFDKQQLINLRNSGLANVIGFSSLLICADDMVAVHVIGSGNVYQGGKICASGAGSINTTYHTSNNFNQLIVNGMNAEIREESGVPEEAIIDTQIIAYARVLECGGIPHFYGVSRTDLKSSCNKKFRSQKQLLLKEDSLFL